MLEFIWMQYAVLGAAFVLSAILTLWLAKQAIKRGWLAIPNERSSHKKPTPSGAGLAVAIVFLGVILLLGAFGVLPKDITMALGVGGAAIALIGWIDELRPLRIWMRLPIHVGAAIYAVHTLGGMPVLFVGMPIQLGLTFGSILAVIGIVWLSNLYNFMDGIDGLVGMQAVFVSAVAGALIAALAGTGPFTFVVWLLGASVAGFLIWNWHPAKIFLGDVGSVLIGFTFGVLALWTESAHALPLFIWFILLAPFMVDATGTTLKRLLQGSRWYEAHRTFSYQLSTKNSSHSMVVLRMLAVNIIVSPLVIFAAYDPRFVIPVFAIVIAIWTMLWHRVQVRSKS
jgi:Fuc2NAc and GlcNAc transferase